MSAAPPPEFPNSAVLAGWWRDLAPRRPRQIWIARLLLHRIEALAEVTHPTPLSAFTRALLGVIANAQGPIQDYLHLETTLCHRVVAELASDGLIASAADGWAVTPCGVEAIRTGKVWRRRRERRVFVYADNAEVGAAPHCLPLGPAAMVRAARPTPWHFDPETIKRDARRSDVWKRQHGFPIEVVDVHDLRDAAVDGDPDWRRVVLDRAEEFYAVFLQPQTGESGAELLGYSVNVDGWALRADAPVLAFGPGWEDALPDLATDPPAEAWRAAWNEWSRSHDVDEADACRLTAANCVLQVEAPPPLYERLRPALADPATDEKWLLAGVGRSRAAARIELIAARS